MAVKIRLSRGGTKKRPYYSIVAADARMPRDGRYLEKIGSYNPMLAKDHADRVKLHIERVQYWLSQGAQPTDRVARFLSAAGLAVAPTIYEQTKKHLPSAATLERKQAKEDKIAALKSVEEKAQIPASEEENPQEETPAEEAAS